MGISLRQFAAESDWRNETLRTNLWLIPAIESMAAVLLFALTMSIDRAASPRPNSGRGCCAHLSGTAVPS